MRQFFGDFSKCYLLRQLRKMLTFALSIGEKAPSNLIPFQGLWIAFDRKYYFEQHCPHVKCDSRVSAHF